MPQTRAKVRVNRIIESDWGKDCKQVDVEFQFVCDDNTPENKKFWEATPSGEFALRGMSDAKGLVPGKEYYLDISEA